MRYVKIISLVVALMGLLTALIGLLVEGIKLVRELPSQSPRAISTTPISSSPNDVSRNPPVEFFNEWLNIDSQTNGIRRVSIQVKDGGTFINMFGACSPTDCNFRESSPAPVVHYDYDPETGILSVKWIMDFEIQTQELTIKPDGQLRVTSHEHFIDNSGRLDYDTVSYFKRQ